MQGFMSDAEAHAFRAAPAEACGLVVNGRYFACNNVASNSKEDFVICPYDYLSAAMSGKIEAVVHSHPKGGGPSGMDKKACQATKLPWFVFDILNEKWSTINP